MKNMKNAMALALALCLALCLCACSQPAAPTTEATEADDGKVTSSSTTTTQG